MRSIVVDLSLLWVTACIIVAALDSCSASLPLPEEVNLSVLPADLGHLTVTDLMMGRELYIDNCGGCHRLYVPEEKTFAEWEKIYKEMGKKIHQTASEKQKLFAYLRAMAKLPADTTSYSY